ncbi:MAG: SdiA-regulated domain-containing protein [Nitrospirales bacterium]|nr:SdiA-regulated domain-containing protein [Nitrospirales bacterium]
MGLLGAIAPSSLIPAHFTANGRLVDAHHFSGTPGENEPLQSPASVDIQDIPLETLKGYQAIRPYFLETDHNKGLEGITWDASRHSFFVIKESQPPLLIQISEELDAILEHRILTQENGFLDTDIPQEKFDVSGMSYDQARDKLWIVSDKAKRVFVYDWETNNVLTSFPLGYGENGTYHEIRKAEGIALDGNGRLYIVSDSEASLYVYHVQ